MKITIVLLYPRRLQEKFEGLNTYVAHMEIPGKKMEYSNMMGAVPIAQKEAFNAQSVDDRRGLKHSDFVAVTAFEGWCAMYMPSHNFFLRTPTPNERPTKDPVPPDRAERIESAARALITDLYESKDDRHPETNREYASVKRLRKELKS